MRKFATVIVLAVILTACSSIKILYSLLDDFIWDSVEFHLNIDDDAEKEFTELKVREMVDWHRSKMLPIYARHLRQQAEFLENDKMSEARLTESFKVGRGLIEATVKGAVPFAAKVLIRHRSKERRTYFLARMSERLAEKIEQLNEPRPERLAKRIERIIDNFERFTGDLSEQQLLTIRSHAERSIEDIPYRLANRRLRQQATIDFLATQPNEAAIAGFLTTLLLRPYEIVQPEYKEFSTAAIERFKGMLFKVVLAMTPKQRNKAAATLREYADDFVALAD